LSEWRKRGCQKWLAHRNSVDESFAISDNNADLAATGIDPDKLLLTLTGRQEASRPGGPGRARIPSFRSPLSGLARFTLIALTLQCPSLFSGLCALCVLGARNSLKLV